MHQTVAQAALEYHGRDRHHTGPTTIDRISWEQP
jgi:hypothetical protein